MNRIPPERQSGAVNDLETLLTALRAAQPELAAALQNELKINKLGKALQQETDEVRKAATDKQGIVDAVKLGELIHQTPEQREIEELREQRKDAERKVGELLTEAHHVLTRWSLEDPRADQVLTRLNQLSPSTTVENVKTAIRLLEFALTPTSPRRYARSNKQAPESRYGLAEARLLVKKLAVEGLTHLQIADRLGKDYERPKRAEWRYLGYNEAIRNPKHKDAVRTQLSKWIRD